MSLEEAIKHCEEKAKELGCSECAKQNLQLADWLKELKSKNNTTTMECGITECCGYDFGVDAFMKNKPLFCPVCGKKIVKLN